MKVFQFTIYSCISGYSASARIVGRVKKPELRLARAEIFPMPDLQGYPKHSAGWDIIYPYRIRKAVCKIGNTWIVGE